MTEESRLGPPPIEPLSETAWARVERGLWSRLDAQSAARAPVAEPPRRWWLAAVPLAAAAAALAVVLVTHTSDLPPDPPSRVVSGTSPSLASFGDAHIELDARTALVMNHEDAHPTVLVEYGAAWFTVAPRLQRPAFLVHAGDATVRVVGTRFRVLRAGERIGVEVDHGLVDVTFRGGVVAVGAGQRWSSDDPGRISAVAPAAPPPAEPAAEPPAAPAEPAAPAPPAPARSQVHRPVRPPPVAATPPPAPTPSAPPSAAAPSGDRDAAEYDRLAALEPRSPSAALTGYLALARGTSPWAAPALFAAGRLAFEHHDDRAVTLLGMYLQRFPTGANAADARKLLAQLTGAAP